MSNRTCGECNLCCKVERVAALEKPVGVWCRYSRAKVGCTIHGQHPVECQEFACVWLANENIGEEWKPSKSRFVLRRELAGAGVSIGIDVDPGFPNAWKDPRYYWQIKQWSEVAAAGTGRVLVYIGGTVWAVFPQEDLLIGEHRRGDQLAIGLHRGSGWVQPSVRIRSEGSEREVLGSRWPVAG